MHLYIISSGKFIIGGPQGDAGMTGRKTIIDTYGGQGAQGDAAFPGKNPTNVDRSAAYACRQMTTFVVKIALCKRALIQLSYAIGVAKPLSQPKYFPARWQIKFQSTTLQRFMHFCKDVHVCVFT